MPDNGPLTGVPYALLPDDPNIEAAVPPGFKHLERFTVPRFENITERNLAFSHPDAVAPEEGQMVFVKNVGFLCWDEETETWVSFARKAGLVEETIKTQIESEHNATTNWKTSAYLSVPVEAHTEYLVTAWIIPEGTLANDIRIMLGGPGDTTWDAGVLGLNFAAPGVAGDIEARAVVNATTNVGQDDDQPFIFNTTPGLTTEDYTNGLFLSRMFTGAAAGDVTVQWKGAGSPSAWLIRGSYLIVKRVGPAF